MACLMLASNVSAPSLKRLFGSVVADFSDSVLSVHDMKMVEGLEETQCRTSCCKMYTN